MCIRDSDATNHTSATCSANVGASVVSLQDHNSATWVANAKGFYVGSYVHEKTGKTRHFKITRINDATSRVEMHIPLFYPSERQVPVSGTVTLHDLLENWSIAKFREPIQVGTGGEVRPNSLKTSDECALIYQALREADTAHQIMNQSLSFWRQPDLVMTDGRGLQKGKLVLVPVVGLANISPCPRHSGPTGRPQSGAATITLKSGATYYASAPARPSDTCSELDKHVVSAYFWVCKTHKADEANMEEGHITTNGIKLPVLKNSVFLRPHTRLVRYVPEPQQVKGTSFVADAAPEPKDVPKAKRTKKAT